MKIKSAKSFRFWYKTKVKKIERKDSNYNENFVGTYHNGNDKKTIKGFFEMYHGHKPDIAGYLPSILKIAEDGQAIYEFLQNAVDCGSTHFYIFYNEKYFLAINNGSPFDIEGLESILNIAQTTKKDPDKIGRFGIGFKLAHRLVGKNEGTDELVRQYKGPILFSWAKLEDLESLLNNERIEPITPQKGVNNGFFDAPYLLKLLLTNFPSDPNETVKDINYKDKVLFPKEELDELVGFLNENFKNHSDSLNKNVLNQGSLFFIKLGEDKKKLLDKDYSELVNGIQYSMNTLKNLEKVYFNNDDIEKIPLQLEEGIIKKGSDEFEKISPEYKDFDIKFAVGFNTIKFGNEKSYEQIKLLKAKPNFYKYFPMGDEINGFGFIVHCDSFSNEANRRKLHEDDVNRNLFPVLAKHITHQLIAYKTKDRNKFLNLYASLLLSDIPDRQNNKWLRPIFYDVLLDSLQKNVPTKNGFLDNARNVKINNLRTSLNLSDFGLGHINWFEWDNEADKLLIDEAKKEDKLSIGEWDIRDIVENANLESINNWIEKNCKKETYERFLREVEDSSLRKKTEERIYQIKFFKFTDGSFKSFKDFLFNPKIYKISNEIEKLGFAMPIFDISKFENICSATTIKPDKEIYQIIAEKCKQNVLTVAEKKRLFLSLNDFDNVGQAALKDLNLFCDSNSVIKPLKKLIGNIKTPSWLNSYKINQDEYFTELDLFLISAPEDLFKEIFQENINDILAELTTVEEIKSLIQLYQDNDKSFFKEFIIRKENNVFVIDEKTNETYQVQSADKGARKFLDENCADNLFVLPYDFVEKYKDEEGIIKADDLHSLILEFVDVDEQKEILVDIVKYTAKHKFLKELSEFRFNSETRYSKEDYEYKILDSACSVLKENDYQKFKDKVVIEAESQDLKLSEIPPFTDKIKIDDYEISLAKILPDNYENSDHLSSLINQFISLGLNKERIGNLFGVSEEPEPSKIFQMFSEQVEVLDNAEQLAFLFLYGLFIEEIDFNKFKALNVDEEEIELGTDKYLTDFDFIQPSEILHQKYKSVTKIFKDFPIEVEDNDNLLLIKKPYFKDDKFICPYIEKDLSDEQKLSFVDFLFDQWNKKNKKTPIKNIDWSKIDDVLTQNILGFNPTNSVNPSKYACESEVLPDYLIKWISKEENNIDFLSDLGVWTKNSVIVELRKFLSGKIKDFNNNRLAQETHFNDDETVLFNSFEWMKEKSINLTKPEQFGIFKKVIEVINNNRDNNDLIIQEEYNFTPLEEQSTEWKSIGEFSIYLFNGLLPKIVKLDEIQDYVFYSYNDSHYAVNGKVLYINENEDKTKTLQKVAIDENNDFTSEDSKDIELSEVKAELEKYKKQDQTKEDNTNPTFLEDVNNFISKLEGTEWSTFVPELKNILELSVSHPKEKQKLFNLIAKIKLSKELDIHFELSNRDYNHLENGIEKYFVHSARGAFAYIHPNEILRMKEEGYKMALDFSTKSRIKIYDTAEEILQLNTNHILAYQYDKTMDELFTFCEANRDANKHLLIIDKNNSGEKSRTLLKLLNIEDDYQ